MRTWAFRQLAVWGRQWVNGLQATAFTLVLGTVAFASTVCAIAAPATAKGFQFVDLALFADSFAAFADGKPLTATPKGVQTYNKVPFRIEKPIAVTGIEAACTGELFPKEIIGIKVGAKAKRVHLLHATLFPDKDGVPLAKIIFRYANGAEESVRLGYGIHARAWSLPRLERRDELVDVNSSLAWSETDDRRGSGLRLFQTALANPKPDEAIASIDVVSLFGRAAPLIFAVSIETPDSTLPPNRPMSERKATRELYEFKDDAYRREMTVRVTDTETGRAVAGALATLSVADDKQSFVFGATKTDANGICRFAYPPQNAVGFTIWVHAQDRMPALISESITNTARFAGEYSAVLKRGVTIGGLVKDARGKPISGAEVLIHRVLRSSGRHYARTDYDNVLTGADGKWKSSCLPPDLTGLTFQVFHPDYRNGFYATEGYAQPPTNTSVSSGSGSSVSTSTSYRRLEDGTLVPVTTTRRAATTRGSGLPLVNTNALLSASAEFTLQAAIFLQGTLADTAGKHIPGAELILQRANSDRTYLRTDAQGRFQARIGEPSEVALVVMREGFAPFWTNIMARSNLPPVALKLSSPRVVNGLVRERNQRPVPGARVRLDEWNGSTDLLRWQTTTDDEGRFSMTGAPSDRVTFYISKTNYSTSRSSFSGPMSTVNITLSRPYGVYGRAYDAETKRPIDFFTVIPGRKYSPNETRINWDRSDAMVGRNGEYSLRMSSYYFQPEGRVLIEAPGYEPQISPPFRNYDAYTNDFVLKKGKGISGTVHLANGSPAANATLVLVEKGDSASLDMNGLFRGSGSSDMARSDARGRFEFSPKLNPDRIFVSHEEGFANAKVSDVDGAPIKLQKWAQIRGTVRVGEKVEPEHNVRLQSINMNFGGGEQPANFYASVRGEIDTNGNFFFQKVPAGEYRVALEYHLRDGNSYGELPVSHGLPAIVKAGDSTNIVLGGTGRRVTGRVNLSGGSNSDVDWRRDVHQLMLVLPNQPGNVPTFTPDGQRLFISNLSGTPQTPEAMADAQRAQRNYVLLFDTNGNFYADNVPAGKYQLTIAVTDPEDEYYNRRYIGNTAKTVTVPDEKNARVNAPFDAGAIDLAIRPRIKVGRVVPSFDLPMADGKTNKLSDYRGKHVLLHFWGQSLGYNSTDFMMLRELQSTYVPGGKLVIIGCNLDPPGQSPEQFIKNNSMTWPQSYHGYWNQSPLATMFGLQGGSMAVLIDPQGRLASAPLRSTSIRSAVLNAFSTELE